MQRSMEKRKKRKEKEKKYIFYVFSKTGMNGEVIQDRPEEFESE